jgi:sulfinoalanine decarboxylase/sulfinoalanine decarboxylase/aspartate 1-decarboxylase
MDEPNDYLKILIAEANDIVEKKQKDWSFFKQLISRKSLLPYAKWKEDKAYTRVCLHECERFELILICWNPFAKTAVHNHNGQSCTVFFFDSDFEEIIYCEEGRQKIETSRVKKGDFSSMKQKNSCHSLQNISDTAALTLHLYHQPIKTCKIINPKNKEKCLDWAVLKYDVNLSNTNQKIKNKPMIEKELEVFGDIVRSLLDDEIKNPVSEVIPPNDLHARLDISLDQKGIPDEIFNEILKEVVLKTPKTSSKNFFNQLFGGRQPKAVLGELLSVVLNNSMYTYKVGGPQVGIEKEIIKKSSALIDYGTNYGGTFAAGGSMSNLMALLMARDQADKRVIGGGVRQKMTAYTSEASHYSVPKNAAFAGIGRDQVRFIATNEKGLMQVDELEKSIQADLANGYLPFFINATAGTTVLGAFDSINPIADLAQKYSLWLHVDGAYCGSVLFSKKYKYLIEGVNRADSFNYNAHKMLGVPLSCSILLVKDKTNLNNSFAKDAAYLYQTDEDDFNLGKTSLQCGRRNDALKLWTLWKSVGSEGLESIVDHQFDLADVARNYLKANSDYTLYSFEDSISVCFNYKGIDAEELCTRLYEKNKLLVGYGSFGGNKFVRFVTINANNSKEDILHFFELLEQEADEYLASTLHIEPMSV